MKNIRVLVRTEADRQALDACREATGEKTAAKALLAAAKMLPAAKRRIEAQEAELAKLRTLKADLAKRLGLD